MSENELRIGNYYKWYADGKYYYFKVDNDTFSDYNVLNNMQPIELTEEILLKCGFQKIGHLYKINLLNSLNLMYNSEHNGWYFDIYHNSSKVELQYLNELQNLYFAVTGQELEINL